MNKKFGNIVIKSNFVYKALALSCMFRM